MWVVDQCVDARSGRVKIPGFGDAIVPPTAQEIADFRASGFSLERFSSDHHLRSLRTSDADDAMLRLWAQPTFEVHGVVGGYAGEGIKTIVPAFAELKVSCRLVPEMTLEGTVERVREFIARIHPDVEVVPQVGLEAFRGITTGPYADAVRKSVAYGFGREPVFVREGGAIGAVVSMQRQLGVPIVFLGLSLPEHGYHAPNEFYDWGQARGGIAAFANYLRRVADV
jgi:acetylornithine deacetylase/succinyl-diaminopimelate desuccinylase-like protein